jgi:kumamolisin
MLRRLGLTVLAAATCALLLSSVATAVRPIAGQRLDGFQALLAASRDLGPVAGSEKVAMILSLRDPSSARRQASIDAISTLGSPSYGRTLTPAQVAAQFGPDPSAVDAVVRALAARGLIADWIRGNPWLTVDASAVQVNATFGTAVHRFQDPDGTRFYASRPDPRVPAFLQPTVVGAGHVNSHAAARLAAVPVGGLKPVDAKTAYDTKPLRDLGIDGSGETIVFWELSDGWVQSDFAAFNQKYGLPAVTPQLKDGPADAKQTGELIMDLEVAHAIAPGAKLVVYTTTFQDNFLQVEDKYVTENPGAILSLSWGGCESSSNADSNRAEAAIYAKADQLGETALVASGDSGGYECMSSRQWGAPPGQDTIGVSAPASEPGVTAVGGTTISVQPNGAWHGETVWEMPTHLGGTGGGISQFFGLPSWQVAPGVQNQYNTTHRSIPDISADADPVSGMSIFTDGGLGQGGGTSQSTPLWAGFTALMDQYLKRNGGRSLGFLNPALYAAARSAQPFPAYHDIVVGTNLVYPATPGYDLATGLGTPDVFNLARDLLAQQKG